MSRGVRIRQFAHAKADFGRGTFPQVRETDCRGAERDRTSSSPTGQLRLFGGLNADERTAVVAQARIRTVNAGETVFAMGAPGDQMMALLRGSIRIRVPSVEGRELLLAIIRPGEVFGELAVLDGKERSADAIAEVHAR